MLKRQEPEHVKKMRREREIHYAWNGLPSNTRCIIIVRAFWRTNAKYRCHFFILLISFYCMIIIPIFSFFLFHFAAFVLIRNIFDLFYPYEAHISLSLHFSLFFHPKKSPEWRCVDVERRTTSHMPNTFDWSLEWSRRHRFSWSITHCQSHFLRILPFISCIVWNWADELNFSYASEFMLWNKIDLSIFIILHVDCEQVTAIRAKIGTISGFSSNRRNKMFPFCFSVHLYYSRPHWRCAK